MAAKRDGSAIKVNHVSVSSSQRARCVATAFSCVTIPPAVISTHKNQRDLYGRIGRKTLKNCVFADLSKQKIFRC